jgi:hypothetical protein
VASLALLALLVALMVSVLCVRPVSRKEFAWFCFQQRITPTLANGPVVVDYLTRTRRWRLFGAVGSLSAMTCWMFLFTTTHSPNLIVVLFAGWFAGGILAELPVGTRRTTGPRAASLVPRRPLAYVQTATRRFVLGSLVIFALANTRHVHIAAVATTLAVAAVAWWGISTVVHRPQPVLAPDLEEADTATRRAAVARICGGWIVLNSIGAYWAFGSGRSLTGMAVVLLVLVQLGSFVGVLTGWLWVPTRVRRTPSQQLVSA